MIEQTAMVLIPNEDDLEDFDVMIEKIKKLPHYKTMHVDAENNMITVYFWHAIIL